MEKHPTTFDPVPVEAEDTMFIMYTSGTTSNSIPANIKHSTAGYLLYTALTHKVALYYKFCSHIDVEGSLHSCKLLLLPCSTCRLFFNSMFLIINLEISLGAWLSLAGSLDIPTWCMVLFAMELLLCSLRALLHILIMVNPLNYWISKIFT